MRRLKAIPTRHGSKMPPHQPAEWTASDRMDSIGQDGRLSPSLPPYINEQTRDNTSGKLQQ